MSSSMSKLDRRTKQLASRCCQRAATVASEASNEIILPRYLICELLGKISTSIPSISTLFVVGRPLCR
eukprot:239871-Karenia_brevis.AAC.1